MDGLNEKQRDAIKETLKMQGKSTENTLRLLAKNEVYMLRIS